MAFPTNIGRDQRRFVRAVCWSLALHGVLLWPVVLPFPAGYVAQRESGAGLERRIDAQVRIATVGRREGASLSAESSVRRAAVSAKGTAALARRSGSAVATTGPDLDSAELDAEDLRAYRLALAVGARSHWHYPAEAFQQGQFGVVNVRVSMAGGGAGMVSLERSSGYRSLDAAAVEMLRAALIATDAPEGLRGRRFSLVIPVEFGLEGKR